MAYRGTIRTFSIEKPKTWGIKLWILEKSGGIKIEKLGKSGGILFLKYNSSP